MVRICIKAVAEIAKATAAGLQVQLVDCEEDKCDEKKPCDPPEGTICSVYHEKGVTHKATDSKGDILGKIIPHVHTYQHNRKPDGTCEWNFRGSAKHTHNFTPINSRPCSEYPSWVRKFGRN